ncbi:hypothetical protein PR048_013604 [Dryococelus australis]|uniref:Uncharacterized protein n=1 Tax=Dryococelus australis TaxID=614101 RepID=A0ABQ9HSN2_9NEOP|nr:hypothetical protein PR048_013604 [Dryococelus australis]
MEGCGVCVATRARDLTVGAGFAGNVEACRVDSELKQHWACDSTWKLIDVKKGAVVAERLACSPPTKVNRVQSPASGYIRIVLNIDDGGEETSMEQCWNVRVRKIRVPGENPPTSDIVQHDSQVLVDHCHRHRHHHHPSSSSSSSSSLSWVGSIPAGCSGGWFLPKVVFPLSLQGRVHNPYASLLDLLLFSPPMLLRRKLNVFIRCGRRGPVTGQPLSDHRPYIFDRQEICEHAAHRNSVTCLSSRNHQMMCNSCGCALSCWYSAPGWP